MGFFSRTPPKDDKPVPAPEAGGLRPRLIAAREKLDLQDLEGAMAIYQEVLSGAGDRADVLLTISGDLGATGHVAQVIEILAPRYDVDRHGPAAGLNLVQAYLAVRNADSAQHVLDLLFSLNRPELEERLHGFAKAVSDLLISGEQPVAEEGSAPVQAKASLMSIGKPIWWYGLEPLGPVVLPAKEGKLRRIAFTQLSLPGAYPDFGAAIKEPEDALARLSRALPLWLADTFTFSAAYLPLAVLAVLEDPSGSRSPMLFDGEWSSEQVRRLVETTDGGLDYVFTGAAKRNADGIQLILRVWDAKKMKERKQFSASWTAQTMDSALSALHGQIRAFMEWAPYPEGQGIVYSPPGSPDLWIETLGTSLLLFLVEKKLMAKEQLPALTPSFDRIAPNAFSSPAASLAWLTLLARARSLGLAPELTEVMLSRNPVVTQAKEVLAG